MKGLLLATVGFVAVGLVVGGCRQKTVEGEAEPEDDGGASSSSSSSSGGNGGGDAGRDGGPAPEAPLAFRRLDF